MPPPQVNELGNISAISVHITRQFFKKKKKNLPPWSTNSRGLTSSLGDAKDGRGADFRGIPLDNGTALTME